MSRLSDQREDLYYGEHISNESNKLPGHQDRVARYMQEIHTRLGPMDAKNLRSGAMMRCGCDICARYRKTGTKGPENRSFKKCQK